jgi:hypothetical protein
MRALRLLAALLVVVGIARGDTPLPPPNKVTAVSPNGAVRAISDPNSGTRVEDVTHGKVLWRLPDWYRSMRVANDGKHLVTEFDGMNLIPLDFRDDFVLLTFWRDGRKIRQITVRDLFPDRRGLVRTVSHYAWRVTMEFDARGRLRVSRVDGKTLLFDVTTGTIVKT